MILKDWLCRATKWKWICHIKTQWLYYALGFALLAILFANLMALWGVREVHSSASWRAHTFRVLYRIEKLNSAMARTEAAARAHVVTGEERYLEEFHVERKAVLACLQGLKEEVSQTRSDEIEELSTVVHARLGEQEEIISVYHAKGRAAVIELVERNLQIALGTQVNVLQEQLQREEEQVVADKSAAVDHHVLQVYVINILASVVGTATIIIVSIFFYRKRRNLEEGNEALTMVSNRLQQSNEVLQGVIHAALSAYIMIDRKGEVIEWNPAAASLFDIQRTEAMGKQIADLIIPETYRELHHQGLRRYLETGEGPVLGKVLELEGMRRNKEIFPIEITITDIKLHDDVVFAAFIRDVTDRREAQQAQQEVQTLFDSALDMICITDMSGIIRANKTMQQIIGLTEEELKKTDLSSFIHPDDLELSADAGIKLTKEQTPLVQFENRWIINNEVRWFSWACTPGAIPGVSYCIGREVTRRKAMEQKLEMVNAELEQFAYVASHDLKAPLRAIANLANWIEEDLGDKVTGESKQHLGLMQDRIKRMNNLIEGILQYSRIGRVYVQEEPLELNPLIKDIIDSIDRKEFTFSIAELPQIVGNRTTVVQLFQNLISNGIKHHARRDGKIEIGVDSESDLLWKFWVQDDGPGIAPQFHDKLFVMFQTLKAKTADSTGIGLALCKKIVERAGGKIWVESDVNKGAKFCFTWPKLLGEIAATDA